MASEESYDVNDEHSEDQFDPEDSGPVGLRGRPRYVQNYAVTREPSHRQSRRQTRGIRNINYSETVRLQQTDGHQNVSHKVAYGEDEQLEEEDLEGRDDDKETQSAFSPNIDVILWRNTRQDGQTEYLVKYKNRSYLHLDWLIQPDLLEVSKSAKNKLNRFNKTFNKRLIEPEIDEETGNQKYFDPSYIEPDRIIATTEIFPVVHQKKANEIRGKWSQSIFMVCQKLLNFTRDQIHYGVFFSQPVNPERDNCPNYRKIVLNPIDLGTILNKILLDTYKKPIEFWNDIGLVWKNCRKFNTQPDSDIRLIGDTLRQASLCLYIQWHKLCSERYEVIKAQLGVAVQANGNGEKVEDANGDTGKQANGIPHEKPEEKAQQPEKLHENGEQQKNGQQAPADIQAIQEGQPVKQGASYIAQSNENGDQPDQMEQQESEEHEICKNVLLESRKADSPTNEEQLARFHPGPLTFQWILEEGETDQSIYQSYEYQILDTYDIKNLNLNIEVDRLYLVKWKNLSYTQATWELESSINTLGGQTKIQAFRNHNRALDRQSRMNMINHNERHKTLVEVELNPRKKARLGYTTINEMRSKLYFMDARNRKHVNIPHYTNQSPPVYKDYKMLRDYQLESLNWLINSWYHNRNVILADEMGLGKTIQSIAFLQHLSCIEGCKGPFLIIAPLSTLQHWKRTVEDWTNMNCVLYYDHNGQPGRASIRYYEWNYTDISTKGSVLQATDLHKFNILITSFEVFLADFQNVMIKIPLQFVVVDEAHRLKNQSAKILQCLKQLPCKRILLLTGTPIQNNTDQLWSLLNYIQPDKFSRREEFRRQFGDLASSQQIQKLHTLLKPYMLRRMKEDVEQSIPPLQQTIIDIEMTTLQKTIYRALYERNKGMLTKGFSGSAITTSLNNLEMQLRKCCNHPFLIKEMETELMKQCKTEDQRIAKILESSGKMTLVNKLLDKYRAEEKKLLIFSQFTYMLQLLEELLKWKGVKYEKIDGQIKAKERQNAIDRYNNKEKKREVFLLSTKAGGIGINLTSANIVIIFDSDWNPQNDVQATARAHRIGQQSEVQVYRLVTAKTYESQMFERAARKLGLDQAIFIDGTFKTTKNDEEDEKTGRHPKKEKTQRGDKNKLSKDELETLLRRGMIGLYEENVKGESENQMFHQDNVDQILQNNSRLAKYSVIKGSYTFAKSRFVSDQADNKLDLKDPNFWNIVLKNVESKSQKILKKLQELSKFKQISAQQQLMVEVQDCAFNLIQSKLSLSGYHAQDEKNLIEVLNIISSSRVFNSKYREYCCEWLEEVSKPSRRFKRRALDQNEIVQGKPTKITRNNREQVEQQGKQRVYFDEDRQSQDMLELPTGKGKQTDQKLDQLLRKLCYLCQRPRCTIFCKDHCKRAFHQECKERVEAGEINTEGVQRYDIEENNMADQRLKQKINVNYVCTDCQNHLLICYICKVKGKYYGAEYHKKKNNLDKSGAGVLRLVKKSPDDGDDDIVVEEDPPANQEAQKPVQNAKRKNEVTKCSTANCAKFYHPQCIQSFDGNSKFKYIDQKLLHFRCSLHYCFKCGDSGETMAIAQCIRCPRAFHLRCMDKEKMTKKSKKLVICDRHVKVKKKEKKAPKPVYLTKKLQKKERHEARKKNLDSDIDSDPQDAEDEQEPQRLVGTTRTRSLLKKSDSTKPGKITTNPIEVKKIAYTYEDLGIQPPWEFDFSKYPEDWCRYCGARFSSNFTQGPWGPKTLCTVHYINWKKKKSLSLEDHMNEKPITPINPRDDQELRYITNLKSKDPDVDLKAFLEVGGFQAYRKKMKKNFDGGPPL